MATYRTIYKITSVHPVGSSDSELGTVCISNVGDVDPHQSKIEVHGTDNKEIARVICRVLNEREYQYKKLAELKEELER